MKDSNRRKTCGLVAESKRKETTPMMHSFRIDEAKKYGMEEAVLIQHFRFHILNHRAEGTHFYDGRFWNWNTIDGLHEQFPYWSKKQIRRVVASLIGQGVLLKGDYHAKAYKNHFNHTTWFAFEDEVAFLESPSPEWESRFAQMGKSTGPDGQMDVPERANPPAQTGTSYKEALKTPITDSHYGTTNETTRAHAQESSNPPQKTVRSLPTETPDPVPVTAAVPPPPEARPRAPQRSETEEIVALLTSYRPYGEDSDHRIDAPQARRLAEKCLDRGWGLCYVDEWIERAQGEDVENPIGYLVRALTEGWSVDEEETPAPAVRGSRRHFVEEPTGNAPGYQANKDPAFLAWKALRASQGAAWALADRPAAPPQPKLGFDPNNPPQKAKDALAAMFPQCADQIRNYGTDRAA